jgi:hypothetical protein
MMTDFEYLTEFLIEEYHQNTYTNELSREDIREISNTLPNTDEWTKASFNDIKEEIRKKYGLSNRKLSRVIDIIKSHRKFCSNIGLEKPLAELSKTSLIKYINIYNSFMSKRYPNSAKDTPPKHINLKTYNKYAKELIASLPRESIICLYTLIELGKLYEYGEQYEHVYSEKYEHAKEEYFFSEYVSNILYNAMALKFINKALQMTGQKTLTNVLQGLASKHKVTQL